MRGRCSADQAVILDEPLSDESTSPLLCGNFIELVYGQQIDSLWTKMQDDRSLEALTKTSGGYWISCMAFAGPRPACWRLPAETPISSLAVSLMGAGGRRPNPTQTLRQHWHLGLPHSR